MSAALSSTVLDNDIVALFIAVPLTIGLRGITHLPITPLRFCDCGTLAYVLL